MLSISVEEFLYWKKKQLSKGGDQQSFAVLLDCIGGISKSDLNLICINPERILPNSISLWDNFLEGLKIKSYKQSTHSQIRNRVNSRYCLQFISRKIRKIIFC